MSLSSDSGSTPSGFLISATHSGAGKTTATAVVLQALRRRGLSVQAFKVGPDFIDTAHHTAICGRPSINLDLWMMEEEGVCCSYRRWASEADVSVIEAMGGLYDGVNGSGDGSAAHVAKLLGVPVVVVLDVWGTTRTAAALLKGLIDFDPEVEIAGCIFNRVGSDRHARMIERALPADLQRKVIGYVARRRELEVAERHLGLMTVQEVESTAAVRERALSEVAESLDVDLLLETGRRARRLDSEVSDAVPTSVQALQERPRLAIARDNGFHFYYEENLRLLCEVGFELVDASPILDDRLPDGVDALYMGGGYPESFAAELAANASFAADLHKRVAEGMPVYGECGGYIYLGRSLTGFDGEPHRMSGLFPIDFAMTEDHLAIAYVALCSRVESPLGPRGTKLRGHEFHQSRIVHSDLVPNLHDVTTSDGRTYREGHVLGSVVGSYSHLHLASNPDIAANLLLAAQAHRATRKNTNENTGANCETVSI